MSVIARIRKTITGGTPHDVLRDAVIADPDGAARWIADLHADVAATQGAVADERTRWVRLILQADELQDPAGALAALVNMARVEHDRPAGGQ